MRYHLEWRANRYVFKSCLNCSESTAGSLRQSGSEFQTVGGIVPWSPCWALPLGPAGGLLSPRLPIQSTATHQTYVSAFNRIFFTDICYVLCDVIFKRFIWYGITKSVQLVKHAVVLKHFFVLRTEPLFSAVGALSYIVLTIQCLWWARCLA